MKFTRLRLIGFKSFVEPTDVPIEPGLTGVVGPNGCGKSNLVEAVRWVMGETSHKAMRAADMESVIFAGTTGRPARNHAEVAITVDNSDRTAPAAFNDQEILEVSRRIERDAGSLYRVNHREVRARDVQLLFADASTGSRSPALVHQGRIGEIIQAKPAQRRMVLEEAAGISGLHARRHEAELRLRAAELNLQRLEDVIGQLTAQIDALKRQARQAIRYRAVSAEVRKAEAMLYHLRFVAADAEVAEAARVKDLSVRVVADRTGAQAEAAKRQALVAAELPGLREAEAKAAAALHRLVVARETLEREEARAKERMAELDRRLVQFGEDIAREQKLAADAEAALARLAAEEATLKAEAQLAAARRSGVDQRVAEAEAVLGGAERTFGELTGALAELTARRNQLEGAAQQHGQRLERLAVEIAQVESDLARLEAEQQGGPDLAALAAAAQAAQAAVGDAETAAISAEAAHAGHRRQDPVEGAGGRDQESVAAGDGLRHRRKRLRGSARGSARRRSRCAGRSLLTDALGRLRPRPGRSGSPGGNRCAQQPCPGARRTGTSARANRRGREVRRRAARRDAQARPAAGFARGRPVALGRLCRRGACADRRRPPPGRTQPPRRHRRRA
jgi:chromosome segregation protein